MQEYIQNVTNFECQLKNKVTKLTVCLVVHAVIVHVSCLEFDSESTDRYQAINVLLSRGVKSPKM